MDKKISTLLREIKDATNWSEPRIAKEIGTSQPTVNRILNGQEDCKGSTLRAISDLHRVVSENSRRATATEPSAGHGGRQPASPCNILDTVPDGSVVIPPQPS